MSWSRIVLIAIKMLIVAAVVFLVWCARDILFGIGYAGEKLPWSCAQIREFHKQYGDAGDKWMADRERLTPAQREEALRCIRKKQS